jgi:hypothetical protein
MTSSADFSMQPLAVIDAAAQFDGLAVRIDRLIKSETPNLIMVASGDDEVHMGFTRSMGRCSNEFREAVTLRVQAYRVVDTEQSFAV